MIALESHQPWSKALIALLAVSALILAFGSAAARAEFGVRKFVVAATNENGTPDVQAGSHPYALTVTFAMNRPPGEVGWEQDLKNAVVELPPGLVGNPDATPRCPYQQFVALEHHAGTCALETTVGVATVYVAESAGTTNLVALSVPVYNLVPPNGVAAEFGYIVAERAPVLLTSSVRTGSDYGVSTGASEIPEAVLTAASKVTIWGVPAAAGHNPTRGGCLSPFFDVPYPYEEVGQGLRGQEAELEGPVGPYNEGEGVAPVRSKGECPTTTPPKPLLTNPTSCGAARTATLTVSSWQEPGALKSEDASLPAIRGCEKLERDFDPTVSVKPETTAGSTASGLEVDVAVPQEGIESPEGLAAPDVKDTTVTLPAGVQVNPSSADGLEACSDAQIGYTGESKQLNPVTEPGVLTPQFTSSPASCPEPSKLANVRIRTPLLEGEFEGSVYLAAPQNFAGLQENPFGSLIALYLVAEEPKTGVLVKLPGKVVMNPETGQVTTSFENTPQLPFSNLQINFFGGPRAALSTPALCGTYQTEAVMTSWSSSVPVRIPSTFNVSSSCSTGGPLPFAPSLAAGVPNINAGAFSPLTTSIGREDGQQAIHNVTLTFPPGVSAVITGVPECAEAQANAGTCGAESQIGEVTASVGVGGDPYTITGGKAYLTGPYDGAPFGLSIVTPAKAGPFVLQEGRPVVVRAKIEINPTTAAVTVATTGEIPRIIDGIPVQIRHINVTANRPGFSINPTSCAPMTVTGSVGGWEGTTVPVSAPFQLANCANLKFEPKIAISTGAHSSKKDGASLDVKISYPKGALGTQSWFEETKLDIPKQLPAELKTIQQACTSATFEHDRAACPKHSMIGHAVVHTPVLPVPLEGPVYFVSFGNAKFPDAVMELSGDNVNVELRGETLIKKGVTSVTFRNTPDVPFESIEVDLPNGEYSEFGTNLGLGKYDFCGHSLTVPTLFKAQNGLEIHQQTPVAIVGCPKAHKKAKKTHKKASSKKK